MTLAFANLIGNVSIKYGIEPLIIAAVIQHESSFNPYAWNPEPHYRYFWNVKTNAPFRAISKAESDSPFPPKDFPTVAGDPDQEWWAQQASWGLMQVMGALARELGWMGRFLPEITNPEIALDLGCKQLNRLQTWAKGDVEQMLAAYNGGKVGNVVRPFKNQMYATTVLSIKDTLTNALK